MTNSTVNESDDNASVESDDTVEVRPGIPKKFGGYTIEKLLGQGAFAEVFLARDRLDRFVALKILKKQFSFDDNFTETFGQEAKMAASLNHENIILIYDQGVINGQFYIAMEYAPEGALQDYMHRQGKLSTAEVKSFTQQIAEALDFAHSNNIIHRDVKPSNILLGYNNRIKLADFGIARAALPGTIRFSTVIQGTPHYMAPEQADPSAKIDLRTDVYALGVVVYQMLSGHLPFGDGDHIDFVDLINKKRTGRLPDIEGVPTYISPVIFKALIPTSELRPRSAGDFAGEVVKVIKQWEVSTAVRQDKRDLAGMAVLAMEQEDWFNAKDHWERVLTLGESAVAERNLVIVNREIDLQNAWTSVSESFAKADWSGANIALNKIQELDPDNIEAPVKLEEAQKQIRWQQLYEEGETAFAAEDFATAVARFSTIFDESPHYRDVAQRLEEFRKNRVKDELNRLRIEALFALVEGNIELARNQAKEISDLDLGREYGAASFLKKFKELIDGAVEDKSETTHKFADLKDTLKVQESRIDTQAEEIETLQSQLTMSQQEAQQKTKEVEALRDEFADRLYDYVKDLQDILDYLQSKFVARFNSREQIDKLKKRIREIAIRGQQLEGKPANPHIDEHTGGSHGEV